MAKTMKMTRSNPPQDGTPGDARFWIYIWYGIDSGVRVGWTNAKSQAIVWLRSYATSGGWAFDKQTRLRYMSPGRAAVQARAEATRRRTDEEAELVALADLWRTA